ncbi:MAG TPA: hypothetical protein VKY37_04220 [Brumimicrobium sp.]|nr:hypothetical protein [Brumimicrobium sp.]
MRTPINPIAHKGINEYTPIAHLEYAQQPLLEQEYYNREVEKRKEDYKQAVERYNNATIVERITQGLVKPELVLPEAPIIPYMINKSQVENMIKIEGMQKSNGNGLLVNFYFEGFNYSQVNVKDSLRKSVKDGVQSIDTVYSSSAEVRHPLRINVVAPNGESYGNQIATSREYKKLKTQNYASRNSAENKIYELIQKEEQSIYLKSIEEINLVLNNQFGTKLMSYTANLYQIKSDKHDYTDLEEASLLAQKGFKLLHANPNQAYEHLSQSYVIWKAALNEHQPDKKARINDKVKVGLLINLLTTAIYTDNWTDAIEYNIVLDNMKLGAQAATELMRLKTIQSDLKKRHDATMH